MLVTSVIMRFVIKAAWHRWDWYISKSSGCWNVDSLNLLFMDFLNCRMTHHCFTCLTGLCTGACAPWSHPCQPHRVDCLQMMSGGAAGSRPHAVMCLNQVLVQVTMNWTCMLLQDSCSCFTDEVSGPFQLLIVHHFLHHSVCVLSIGLYKNIYLEFLYFSIITEL